MLLAVLPKLVSVGAMLPRLSSDRLTLCLGVSISDENLTPGAGNDSSLVGLPKESCSNGLSCLFSDNGLDSDIRTSMVVS